MKIDATIEVQSNGNSSGETFPPELPGGFRAVRALAHTTLCDVLLVEAERQDLKLVWKILRAEATLDPDSLARFLDEAAVLYLVQHPYVVKSLGAGRLPDGRYYLATEYLEGRALSEHLRARGPLRPDEVIALFACVCEGLEHLHERGIIHRDLRPANIFLCGGVEALNPRLIDFGLAHLRGVRTSQTLPGLPPIRAEYCAPECAQGHVADARSDVYALGCAMYEALTGRPPFSAPDFAALLELHVRAPAPPLPAEVGALAPVVMRCLEKDATARYPSAKALCGALEEFGVLPSVRPPSSQPSAPWLEPVSVGDVLGSYRIEHLLGEGSMSQVFLARHVRLDRKVALKVLKPEQALQPNLVDRFFREARAVNRIDHPHIVQIHDFVEEPGPRGGRRVYCVMEHLEGRTLRALMAEPIPLSRSVRIMRQVCAALAAAHKVGVIHRDVKPENILVTDSADGDFVKVLDFGVAKLQEADGGELVSRTLAGVIIGSPRYMSPEQARGHDVDLRADVYSVGTILYELIAGVPPFNGAGLLDLTLKIVHERPKPLPDTSLRNEPVYGGLKRAIIRCLEKAPADRFANMEALDEVLALFDRDGLFEDESAKEQQASLEAAEDLSSLRTHRWWPWIAAPVALGTLIAAGLAVSRPDDAARVEPPVRIKPALVETAATPGAAADAPRAASVSSPARAVPATPLPAPAQPAALPASASAGTGPAAAVRAAVAAQSPAPLAVPRPAREPVRKAPIVRKRARPQTEPSLSHDGIIDPYGSDSSE